MAQFQTSVLFCTFLASGGGGFSLSGQRVDVADLPGDGHGEAVDDVEMLLPEQQQPLTGVQPLDPGAAVHVLDLRGSEVSWRSARVDSVRLGSVQFSLVQLNSGRVKGGKVERSKKVVGKVAKAKPEGGRI